MPSYIVRDSIMIKEDSFGELLRETPLTVPIVFGKFVLLLIKFLS